VATAAEHQRMIESLGWDGLRELWENIQQDNTLGWDSGKAFEYLVLRAFQLDGAEVTWPYEVSLFGEEVIEQIDGAVHCVGLSCLVESKDLGAAVNFEPIAKLRSQLLRRPASTVGLLFSRTGFTNPAVQLAHFLAPQTILLWTGNEIEYVLEQEAICELLKFKYRWYVERGKPNQDVRLRDPHTRRETE
jgi:hypothetical protein